MRNIDLVILGTAKPQGSKNGYYQNGRVRIVESTKGVKEWREAVRLQILRQMETAGWQAPEKDVAFAVTYRFVMPRPKTNRLKYHTTKPDLDKLVRAVNDSATTAGLWLDDSKVVKMVLVKEYGEQPRVEMGVSVLT